MLRQWTASAAAYQLVLIPLVTVTLSVALQGEQIRMIEPSSEREQGKST